MKRFFVAIIACLALCVSFAGCGTYDPLSDTSATLTTGASDSTSAEADATQPASRDAKEYKNNLAGLRDYMNDLGYISYDKKTGSQKMQAELIGAAKGYRYTKDAVTVELYAYNTKELNSTAEEVTESVKSKGSFNLYEQEITAYLSDNSRYLMIYTDPAVAKDDTSSDAYKTMKKAIKAFKSFNP